jgi:cystathionine beta-lyase/cystathionine gamma-synthase
MRVSALLSAYRMVLGGVPCREARADLHAIWEPNHTWRRYVANAALRAIPKPVRLETERLLAELEGGPALLFPSGSAATTALVLALLAPGARIAVADGGYYGTFGLLCQELGRWGLEVVGFDQTGRNLQQCRLA